MSSPEKLKRICLELPRLEGRESEERVSLAQRRGALIYHSNGNQCWTLWRTKWCYHKGCGWTSAGPQADLEGEKRMMKAVSWFIAMGGKCYLENS